MLRKGATFHSPTSPVSDHSATFSPPSLSRSQSNLDDVVDAHRRRVALTLDSIGKTLATLRIAPAASNAATANASGAVLFDDDCLPRGLLNHTIVGSAQASADQRRVLQPRSVNRRLSDSGIGSSIASSSGKKHQAAHQQAQQPTAKQQTKQAKKATIKAVTRSVAAVSASAEKPAGLSARATNRVYEHTVKPLLAKPAFKAFHPILLECTTKINKKDIVCLRDLEKTILFLAPVSQLCIHTGAWGDAYRSLCIKERTKVAKLYLAFCLESIRCLQTTVDYLSDRERTRPSDPPYTAGYFIDLVEQIHHYAQQLADARDKETSGIATMDARSSDQLKLHGGIAVNGRPAELVRVSRDGRAVSIATGLPVELEEDAKDAIRIKRSASQELEDEEEIMRSMARRKKNAPPEEYAPKMCSVPGCTKEFKRPCDLTKHEKTHSRPWKCPLESCKYHDYGWPTEKERDRHMNDKHSVDPPMFECLYKPCTYKSKRDSNRKQHMEKTHGWKYVRTKTNGTSKSPAAPASSQSPAYASEMYAQQTHTPSSTAKSTTLPTPQLVNLPTPVSAQSPAVATPLLDEFSAPLFGHQSLADLEFPTCAPGDILATDMTLPADMNDLDFSPMPMDFNDASVYGSPSAASSLDNNSAYQDIGQDMTMYEDIYSAPVQLPTPEPVFGNNYATGGKSLLDQFMAIQAPALCAPMITPQQQQQIARLQEMHQMQQQQERRQLQQQQQANQLANQMVPHFSPLGEGNAMLFTPDSIVDEGFGDFVDESAKKGMDFILYPPADASSMTTLKTDAVHDPLFDDMVPSMAAGYSQPTSQVFSNLDWF